MFSVSEYPLGLVVDFRKHEAFVVGMVKIVQSLLFCLGWCCNFTMFFDLSTLIMFSIIENGDKHVLCLFVIMTHRFKTNVGILVFCIVHR